MGELNSAASAEKLAVKISLISIGLSCALFVFKLLCGIFGNSFALISDSVNSASDVLFTLIVILGIKISNKKADKKHPFGHERYECVAAILLSVVLFLTGVAIGFSGGKNIVTGAYKSFEKPDGVALAGAIVSILVKIIMFTYTFSAAKKINSSALKADAWNHASDVLSSGGGLAGIIGGICGVLVLDSAASILICLFIIKAAIDIFIDAINKMTDEACDPVTEENMKNFIGSCKGVKRVDLLMTRLFGNRVYVIAEIACDKDLKLSEAHAIAEAIHAGIEQNFPQVKHVTVHVNPYDGAI